MKHQKRTSRDGRTSYYVRIHVGGGKYESVGTFPTKRAADAAYEDAKARLRGGQSTRLNDADFTTFTQTWLSTLTVKPRTRKDYENTCRSLCAHFGRKQLKAITPDDVRAFVHAFSQTHAPYTTKKAVTRLRQILSTAVEDGYLAKSPAKRIGNMPRLTNQNEIAVLETNQIKALTDAVPEYWRPLIQVAVRTGLRRGELFGLRWKDVHWKKKQIQVVYQLADEVLDEPKSNAAKRKIDVGDALLDLLRAHQKVCPESDYGLVFPTPSGRPVHAGNFQRSVWEPARKKAGLPKLRLHDLRHTFASLLIHNRESVKYVQTVMGHADAQTTLNVYGHLFEASGSEAANRLETALSSTS